MLDQDNGCSACVQIEYRISGVTETFTRRYTDVFSAFADFGGFFQLVVSGGLFLIYFYNQYVSALALRLVVLSVDTLKVFTDNRLLKQDKSNKDEEQRIIGAAFESSRSNFGLNQIQPSGGHQKLSNKSMSKTLRELSKMADEMIDKHTDISEIVKDMASWSVLRDTLLAPHQIQLGPLVAMEMQRKTRSETSLMGGKKTSGHDLLKKGLIGNTIGYDNALEKLNEKIDSEVEQPGAISKKDGVFETSNEVKSIQNMIDITIKINLPNFVTDSSSLTTGRAFLMKSTGSTNRLPIPHSDINGKESQKMTTYTAGNPVKNLENPGLKKKKSSLHPKRIKIHI